ncbi:hypothetical protein PJO24_004523 [Salmonella enterica]|nr:hypothetical protein [Salmonella enterica]
MKINIFIIIFVIFSSHSFSKEKNIKLDDVNFFSLGNNGYIGKISEGEKIYRIAKEKKSAYNFFMRVVKNKNSTPESKLYAACYLKENYPKEYLEEIKNLNVSVLNGDVLRSYKFYEIYFNILKKGCN